MLRDIFPLKKPITTTLQIPGSKSYTNRALIMAALTKNVVSLNNPLYCEDTNAMIDCLRTLGLKITTEPDKIIVHNDIRDIRENTVQLTAQDSGTTLRFILALLCIVPGIKIIHGNKSLSSRPIKELVNGLRELGASIEYCNKEEELPIKISSSSLIHNSLSIESNRSSQFCSALLLISPYLPQGCTIHIPDHLISKSYVDMTIRYMQEWGVDVIETKKTYHVPHAFYQKERDVIEGDCSSSCYFFAIAALTKSKITIKNISASSLQPDLKFLSHLEKMGSLISYGSNNISIEGKGVVPLNIDMEECPDQILTMAVLAAFAKGITKISGIRSLRFKESNRVAALKTELKKIGIDTRETQNTLTIYGGIPKKAIIDTYYDHRMAMAFAVAGLHSGITIRHPEVVNKTFPTFWDLFGSLE